MNRWAWTFVAAAACTSCSSVSKITDSELSSGVYLLPASGERGEKTKQRVYLEEAGDSTSYKPIDKHQVATGPAVRVTSGQVFQKPSFDIDVLVVVFKYRPGLASVPSQLTTDFNGNLFLGYRRDWYSVTDKSTPYGWKRKVSQKSISVGGFAGIGTTFVSPWTTNHRTTDEYSGFILSKGVSAMVGVKSLTVGLGVGWDNLVDRDKDIWVYQFKPWYGLSLSLNLN
ncbi:MAG: hypothetical protein JNN04_05840 [Cyclobacteriaceae bacterium]|nr:hypothetical protein [Cyclobacteriaceae bacterium]